MIQIERIEDPGEALERSRPLLLLNNVGNNLIASLFQECRIRKTLVETWFAEENGSLAGIAMRTPGHALNVGIMSREIIQAMVSRISEDAPNLSGVYGLASSATCFAANWNFRLQRGVQIQAAEALLSFVPGQDALESPEVEIYRADPSHRSDVLELFSRFCSETGVDPTFATTVVDQRLLEGRYWLIRLAGQVAGLAALSLPVINTVRIQASYTVPELRNRGLATVSARALAHVAGKDGLTAVLLTDLANPSSNRAFTKAGFRLSSENLRFSFERNFGSEYQ